MRRLVQCIADGLLAWMIGFLMIAPRFSLPRVVKANARRASAFRYYRPVYSRSGRRNRVKI
jgi:hypothetical protein